MSLCPCENIFEELICRGGNTESALLRGLLPVRGNLSTRPPPCPPTFVSLNRACSLEGGRELEACLPPVHKGSWEPASLQCTKSWRVQTSASAALSPCWRGCGVAWNLAMQVVCGGVSSEEIWWNISQQFCQLVNSSWLSEFKQMLNKLLLF